MIKAVILIQYLQNMWKAYEKCNYPHFHLHEKRKEYSYRWRTISVTVALEDDANNELRNDINIEIAHDRYNWKVKITVAQLLW